VMIADSGAGGEPFTKPVAKLVDCRLMFFCWQIHGHFLWSL